jgi:hypothetical protein
MLSPHLKYTIHINNLQSSPQIYDAYKYLTEERKIKERKGGREGRKEGRKGRKEGRKENRKKKKSKE